MAQAPELAGGAGFTFEDTVAATYLGALLTEAFAPGIENRTVCRVALQQRDFGEPLDDVIIDFRSGASELARLSLQVKRALTISKAAKNKDFRDVMRDSWLTLHKTGFRLGVDRYGVAVGQVAQGPARGLRALAELARASVTHADFDARFKAGGNASAALTKLRADITAVLKELTKGPISPDAAHRFFAHLVLIEFDNLHEGAVSPPAALNALRPALVAERQDDVANLWGRLCRIVREGAGRSAVFDRQQLVRPLSASFRLAGAPSWRADLNAIAVLTRQWLADIEDDVGGARLERPRLASALADALSKSRFVQISGLPGSGKSVLLRHAVEAGLQTGPVLLLKSGRLEGTGWGSFATVNGLSAGSLTDLLVEVAATGSSTLYIDGIDRVEKQHQAIVLDLLRAILGSPLLDNWRVVVTLRDSGVEPLRNWLGSTLTQTSVGTVAVEGLNDEEAEQLSQAKPHLRPLLFGSPEVREIVRRPFFAKVLNQNFSADVGDAGFEPQSEIDLIGNWWARGGYDSSGQSALERQRAIVELGAVRARRLDRDIGLRDLSAATVGVVEQLVADGLVQHVRSGQTVRFAHDIFFEWAFFHVLTDREDDWLEEICACGEPPAVGRVVELLSQLQYSQPGTWRQTLERIAASEMRPQWTRAWLLAPVAVSSFSSNAGAFTEAVEADDWRFLQKALVWFQAERTTPNPEILQRDLPEDQRLRLADLLGWPSDFAAWRRFIAYLLARRDTTPVRLYPDMLSVFEVWQNVFAGVRNAVSDALLDCVHAWLKEFMAAEAEDRPPPTPSRWTALDGEFGDFRRSLARLVLRSAAARPDIAGEFLDLVVASERVRDRAYEEIVLFSPTLARSHPEKLAALTAKHVKEDLPQEQLDREEAEAAQAAELRAKARAIPEAQRTRKEQMAAEGFFGRMGMSSFSYHDWETLALDRGLQTFWPPSPLREPFQSLFASAPDVAIGLIAELSNHAMTAWRQLHSLSDERSGTPIPLEIPFPWRAQQFWGGDREYLWHRGTWAPKVLGCGYMAMEAWALAELERGTEPDDLIQRIVAGNSCIAVLGVAVTIAIKSEAMSEGVLALASSQRLLSADHQRWRHDAVDKTSSLIGFDKPEDLPHAQAVKSSNELPLRAQDLKSVVSRLFLFGGDLSPQVKAAVDGFAAAAPFALEEHRTISEAREALLAQALEYAELVDIETYRRVATPEPDQVAVVHVSPTMQSPERVAQAQAAGARLREVALWRWAATSFENGAPPDTWPLADAIAFARSIDGESLFAEPDEADDFLDMRRGGVAGAAAVALRHRETLTAEDLDWARDVLVRAIAPTETSEGLWTSASVIPWHASISAARGLSADIRAATAPDGANEALVQLVAHPLDVVSLSALEEALGLWDFDPRLGWCALFLALSLCSVPPRQRVGPTEPLHAPETLRKQVEIALSHYRSPGTLPALPIPPAPWVRVGDQRGSPTLCEDYEEPVVGDDASVWAPSGIHWHSSYAAAVIARIPYEQMLADTSARAELVAFLTAQLSWTIAKGSPPGTDRRQRDRADTQISEWTRALGQLLGQIAGSCTFTEVESAFLKPIFALDDDRCWRLLAPFVDTYTRRHLYEAASVPPDAAGILLLCLERLLTASAFNPKSYRAGELNGFDQPNLALALMFVQVERANLAARFANGDWSEIELILPVVDRFIRAAGWSASIMSKFLTLCERARAHYPAEAFADQVLAAIDEDELELQGWHGTLLPARIAALVQFLADRDTPMTRPLGQKLLRILDLLVDMGDRRSAALQLSETFRQVQAV